MKAQPGPLVIVGGGLAGSLLAILLARRGLQPLVVEREAPSDSPAPARDRSINLALAARGIEWPSTSIVPRFALSRPRMSRIVVVFPAPFGPMKA